jgi:hypothetical protein
MSMLSLLKKLFSTKKSDAEVQDPATKLWPFPPAIATSEAPVEVAPEAKTEAAPVKKPAAKKPRVAAKAPATRKPRAPRAPKAQ